MIPPLPHPAGPTTPQNRKIEWDVLRALALLGILLVNMDDFRSPEIYRQLAMLPVWEGVWTLDIATSSLIQWLVAGKCITLFTIAFGFGLQRILDRMSAAGVSPWIPGLRRLGFLFLLGLLHVLAVWFGDILMHYALVGVALVFTHRFPGYVKLALAAILMCFTLMVFLGLWVVGLMMEDDGQELFILMQRSLEAYATGSWGEIFVQRMIDLAWCWYILILYSPMALALMLLGSWAAQSGWLEREGLKRRLQTLMWAGLAVGLPMNAWCMVLDIGFLESSVPVDFFWIISSLVGPLCLSLGYLAAILLLIRTSALAKVWSYLAPAGRMTLSLYLMQSVVATLIFYNYGLGLFGQVGSFHGFLLALLIFIVQAGLAWVWLKHFRYGPLEAAWRWATYGRHFRIQQPYNHHK